MARPICVVCGDPRTPIPGWPPNLKIHPMCLPEGHVVWTRRQMTQWLADREPRPETTPDPAAKGPRT